MKTRNKKPMGLVEAATSGMVEALFDKGASPAEIGKTCAEFARDLHKRSNQDNNEMAEVEAVAYGITWALIRKGASSEKIGETCAKFVIYLCKKPYVANTYIQPNPNVLFPHKETPRQQNNRMKHQTTIQLLPSHRSLPHNA